jgi:hypothetical protein
MSCPIEFFERRISEKRRMKIFFMLRGLKSKIDTRSVSLLPRSVFLPKIDDTMERNFAALKWKSPCAQKPNARARGGGFMIYPPCSKCSISNKEQGVIVLNRPICGY